MPREVPSYRGRVSYITIKDSSSIGMFYGTLDRIPSRVLGQGCPTSGLVSRLGHLETSPIPSVGLPCAPFQEKTGTDLSNEI